LGKTAKSLGFGEPHSYPDKSASTEVVLKAEPDGHQLGECIMSVMAIGPVPFVNPTSLVDTPKPESQGSQRDRGQKASAQMASDTPTSGTVELAV